MKALDRSVETLGPWIATSSVTFIKAANQSSIKPCQKKIIFTIKIQNNEILTLSISMFSSFKCKSIQKEIPHASCSGVAFVQNAREQNVLMDYNWMNTYFIKAHDGPILSRLKNYNRERFYNINIK